MFFVAVLVVLLSVLYLLYSQQDAAVDDQVHAASMCMVHDFSSPTRRYRQTRLAGCEMPACPPLFMLSLTG